MIFARNNGKQIRTPWGSVGYRPLLSEMAKATLLLCPNTVNKHPPLNSSLPFSTHQCGRSQCTRSASRRGRHLFIVCYGTCRACCDSMAVWKAPCWALTRKDSESRDGIELPICPSVTAEKVDRVTFAGAATRDDDCCFPVFLTLSQDGDSPVCPSLFAMHFSSQYLLFLSAPHPPMLFLLLLILDAKRADLVCCEKYNQWMIIRYSYRKK